MIIEEELLLPWIFTLIVIVFKFGIGLFMLNLILKQTKEEGKFRLTFIFALFVFIISLALSRMCYFVYDFYLTKFDPNLLYVSPNIWYWKTANLITTFGGVLVLYTLDKLVYQMKLKKIPEIVLVIVAIVQFSYPITDKKSFDTVSAIGLIGTVISIVIPLTFIWLGIKSAGQLRHTSFTLGFVIIFYALIGQLLSEPILASLESSYSPARDLVIIMVPILKMVSLTILAYAATKFKI